MPESPPDGLMLPMKAISSTKANVSAAGNTRPVKTISAAPARNRLRSSNRGAMKPVSKVSAAVPSSEALATMPICCGLKPTADRYTGKMMMAKPSPKPRSARAAYRQRISEGVLIELFAMSHLRKMERDNAWLRAADRAVADDPGSMQIITRGGAFKGSK